MNWTDRYLTWLGVEKAQPTYSFLQTLIEAHLECVPFEICSKYHYYAGADMQNLIPSKEQFLDHLTERGWGGNCYILNIHFAGLLRSLGFDVEYVRASGGNAHLGNRVTVGGRSYYVDVGYMAPLFEPLALEEEPHFVRCGEEIIVTRVGDEAYRIDRRSGGQSFVVKTIHWTPVDLSAFTEDIVHSHRDEDDNPFMRRMVATLFKNRVCYQVVNAKLLIKSDTDIQVKEYADRGEWMRMMDEVFHLREDDLSWVLAFLAERDVRLFAGSA